MNISETILKSISGVMPVDGGPVVVALSGGADSVCLLLALQELGYRLTALHCNFELRGVESDADEAFCRKLCRTRGVPLTVRHFRTRSYATRRGISVEMAARELRYEWFQEVAAGCGAQAVCVAHHRDDSVETLLLNLIRGTGLHGLTGIKTVSRQGVDVVPVVRPLLSLSRADIEAWLTERGQTWVTDSTNLDADAALRNRIRLRLLPLMEDINPRVRESLAETSTRLGEAEHFFIRGVEQAKLDAMPAQDIIDVSALKASAAPQTLLYEILSPLGFHADQISDILAGLDGEPGHLWHSSTHRLLRDRGRLLIDPQPSASSATAQTHTGQVLPLEGLFVGSEGLRLLVRRCAVDATFEVPRDAATACFDLEKLALPLTLRKTREGDRFQPFGMTGSRLVSDFLTDRKLSLFEKERQPVVTDADGHIVWLVGLRVAAGCEVDETTRHVMTLTML